MEYFPEIFDEDLRASMVHSPNAPFFNLSHLISHVPESRRTDFTACMYLAVLVDQIIATYDLGRRPQFGLRESLRQRDQRWNLGRGPASYPKYGPCGVARAHGRPHRIFVESCQLGVHHLDTLEERLQEDFGGLLPHAQTFISRTGCSASTHHVFMRVYADPDVRASHRTARRGIEGLVKWRVFSALEAHRSLVLWSWR